MADIKSIIKHVYNMQDDNLIIETPGDNFIHCTHENTNQYCDLLLEERKHENGVLWVKQCPVCKKVYYHE